MTGFETDHYEETSWLHENICLNRHGFCGCMNPEEGWALVRDVLALAPFYEGDNWDKVKVLLPTMGMRQIVIGWITNMDLLEHGGVFRCSWITDSGITLLCHLVDHWDGESDICDICP